jgi:hypothetical protein
MKSRKPWSNISRRRTARVQPRAPASVRIGCCLLCGENFTGPKALRLTHGCIQWRGHKAELIKLRFDDHDRHKWICHGCGLDYYILADEGYQFSSHLDGLSQGWCCLCKKEIEPCSSENWTSAILIELGSMVPSGKGPGQIFEPADSGHLHFMCMDELQIELWRLIETSDTPPDYQEQLSGYENR